MRQHLFSFLLGAVFFLGVFAVSRDALAVQLTNKSEQKIAAAVLRVKGERKTTLFVKILQPGAVLNFAPLAGDGSLLVSVKVFDTKETLRAPDIAADARLRFENGKLVPEAIPQS